MNQLFVGAAVVVSAFLAGWTVKGWHTGSLEAVELVAQNKADEQRRELVADIAEKVNKAISNIEIVNTTINRDIRNEIVEKPVYSECVVPIDGVRLLRSARGYGSESDDTVSAGTGFKN